MRQTEKARTSTRNKFAWIVYVTARWFRGWRELAQFPDRQLALAYARKRKLQNYRVGEFRG
jgi:hypothetical protein